MITLPEIKKSHVRAEGIVHVPSIGYRAVKGAEWPCDHWSVTLTYQGRTYTTDYRTGIGHRKACRNEGPGYYQDHSTVKIDAKGMLECLFSDASSAFDTFESWCSDFGYETDSRKALDTYLTCQRTATDLRRLLGADYDAIEKHVRDEDRS